MLPQPGRRRRAVPGYDVGDEPLLGGLRGPLGQPDHVLRSHPEVAEAVVRLAEGTPETSEKRLVAYVVPRDGSPSPPGLREHLRRYLPEFMIPAGFALLAALPLTSHGKVDRAALARIRAASAEEATGDYIPPRTPAEELLAGIWAEALGVERVGANDNFFDLSGHSLLATRVVHRVRAVFAVELPLRSLFERASLSDLAGEIEARQRGEETAIADLPPIERVPREPLLPAAPYQRLLVLAQGGLVSNAYNMPFSLHLRGPLDLPALFLAYAELLRRHESLRTTLCWQDGDLYQKIAQAVDAVTLPVVDLEGLPSARRRDVAVALSLDEQVRPIDVSREILRAYLVRLSREEHVFVVNIHHSMSDGWSLEVLREDLTALYVSFARRQSPTLPPLPVQYADYAAWARQAFRGEGFEARLAYWRERLEGRPPGLQLPAPRPRPERIGPRVQVAELALGGEDLRELRALVRRQGVTLPMALFATLSLLFHRYTGRDDLVLGSASSMRDRAELTGLIGLIMNVLPVRIRFAGLAVFSDLLERVRSEVLGAYSHAVPLPELSAALCPDEPPSRTLFHNMVFNMGSFRASTLPDRPREDDLPSLQVGRLTIWEGEAKYDLNLQCFDQGDVLLAVFLAPADLIAKDELASLRDDYRELLLQAVREPAA
ncbi:MAG TPA: condensation domain-containing protein, partial [Thermoanaerobaculia bacterium]|nr:condensation domain-containing protein [Thermoanaerobaculia bacterium]